MPLDQNSFIEIKSIINKFISENGFIKSEDDVQTYYTIKILELLGWTSDKTTINTTQTIRTGERPDILLRGAGGGTIFIVESKEPRKSLDGKYQNKTFIDQICQYCNSEGIYWGILTNFVEWRIYNSYRKEIYDDKGIVYKINTIIDNKINSKDELYNFFNKITYDNLNSCKGRIDVSSIYYKKQEEIKEEFFDNLKSWRNKLRNFLYKNYKNKYKDNISEKCDHLTQKILDRMIFMEVCNDKNIISYDILGSILYSKKNKFEELKSKFQELDDKFNSDLFAEDNDIDSLEIDDDPMEIIIRGINNIDFSNLSVQIIGEVYENYLGELLRKGKNELTIQKSKEKTKRKEQGIYYTPDYIVNYIVDNTLGEVLNKCRTQEEIQKIRVLDPACGSGSFLIRAFDLFYNAYKMKRDTLGLFDEFEIKKRILLHNLFGVDIDDRAVEICKLNLLIKALENISDSAIEGKRKLLPNLNLNIRCGNSLVTGINSNKTKNESLFDSDSENTEDLNILINLKEIYRKSLDDKDKEKHLHNIYVLEEKLNSKSSKRLEDFFKRLDGIKPFNYEIAFCDIFKDGGFDCIIGNPPWVFTRGQMISHMEKIYYENYLLEKGVLKTIKGKNIQSGKLNLYALFIVRSLDLLKNNSDFGFIIPNNLLRTTSYDIVRKFLLDNVGIKSIIDLGMGVFEGVTASTIILLFQKQTNKDKRESKNIKIITDVNNIQNKEYKEHYLSQKTFESNTSYTFNILSDNISTNISNKLKSQSIKLGDLCEYIIEGIVGNIKEHVFDRKINNKYKPFLVGKDIKRYTINYKNKYIYYNREKLHRARPETVFLSNKIMIQRISGGSNPIVAALDGGKYYTFASINNVVLKNGIKYNIKYILGLLNSRLLNWFYSTNYSNRSSLTVNISKTFLEQLPIHKIDFKNKDEKLAHDKLVKLVSEMISLCRKPEINKIKIEAKKIEIDDAVFSLYSIENPEIDFINKY